MSGESIFFFALSRVLGEGEGWGFGFFSQEEQTPFLPQNVVFFGSRGSHLRCLVMVALIFRAKRAILAEPVF